MAIIIDVSEIELLRDPIDRAYHEGYAAGVAMGRSVGYRETMALYEFVQAARNRYGERLIQIALTGIRDGGIDVAVVLDQVDNRDAERNRLADIAYEAVVEHKVDVNALAISEAEWRDPELHSNPAQIRAIKRDGFNLI